MVGFEPSDALVGNRPTHRKCTRTEDTIIIYLANPNGNEPEKDNVSDLVPDVTVNIDDDSVARWFNPQTGVWHVALELSAGMHTLIAPVDGDWVLLIRKVLDQ